MLWLAREPGTFRSKTQHFSLAKNTSWPFGTFEGFFYILIQELLHHLRRVRQERQCPDVNQLDTFIEAMLLELLLVRIREQYIRPEHTALIRPVSSVLVHNCVPIPMHRINVLFLRSGLLIPSYTIFVSYLKMYCNSVGKVIALNECNSLRKRITTIGALHPQLGMDD